MYSRYNKFEKNGRCEFVPYIPIIKQSSDYYVTFDSKKMRMDTLSHTYYGNPNYGWVILQANPQYGSLEFLIPNGSVLRIPYPIETVLTAYNNAIDKHKTLY